MFRLSEVGSISGAGAPNYLNSCYRLRLDTDELYVVSYKDATLSAFDISDPTSISLLDVIGGAGAPNYLDGAASLALYTKSSVRYAAVVSYLDNSLSIFNVDTPSSISLTDSIQGAGSPNYLSGAIDIAIADISGYKAFVTSCKDNSLSIFNIDNPASISFISNISGIGSPNYLSGAHGIVVKQISGTWYAFVVSLLDNSLSVFNVNAPASPSLVTELHGDSSPYYLGGAHSIVSSGDYLYITSYDDDAIVVYDVSTPGSPSLASYLTGEDNYLGKPCGLAYTTVDSKNVLLVANYLLDCISVFDITTPANISLIGYLTDSDNEDINSVHDIDANTTHAFITSYEIDKVLALSMEYESKPITGTANIVTSVIGNAYIAGTSSITGTANIATSVIALLEDEIPDFTVELEKPHFFPIIRAYMLDSLSQEIEITDKVKNHNRVLWQIEQPLAVNEFTANNCNIELRNEDEEFDTDNESNYFVTTLSKDQSGYRVPIIIKCGYVDEDGVEHLIPVFYGLIINIDVSTFDDVAVIDTQCISRVLRDAKCSDIGDQWTDQQIFGGDLNVRSTRPISDTDAYIPVQDLDSIEDFPDFGYLLIDDEIISYGGKGTIYTPSFNAVGFLYCNRGQHGTTRTAHDNDTSIYFCLDDGTPSDGIFFQFPVYPISKDSIDSVTSSDGEIIIADESGVRLNVKYDERKLYGFIDYDAGVLELGGVPTDSGSLRATYKSVPRIKTYHSLVKQLLESESLSTNLIEDVILSDRLARYIPYSHGRAVAADYGDTQMSLYNLPCHAILANSDGIWLGIGGKLVLWDGDSFIQKADLGSGYDIVKLADDSNDNIYGIVRPGDLTSKGWVFKFDGSVLSFLTDQIAAYYNYGYTADYEGAQWKGFSIDEDNDCCWFLYKGTILRGIAKVPLSGGSITAYTRSVYSDRVSDFADSGDDIEFFYAYETGGVIYIRYESLDKSTGTFILRGNLSHGVTVNGTVLMPTDACYNPSDDKVYLNVLSIYDPPDEGFEGWWETYAFGAMFRSFESTSPIVWNGWFMSVPKGSSSNTDIVTYSDSKAMRSKFSGLTYHDDYIYCIRGTELALGLDSRDDEQIDDATGNLYRVNDNTIEDLGTMAYRPISSRERFIRDPISGVAAQLSYRVSDDSLYMILCDATTRFDQQYGFSICRYAKTVSPTIRSANISDRSKWDVMSELASLANYELGVSRYGRIFYRERKAEKTFLTSAITDSDVTIPVFSTDGFPDSGLIEIAVEIISYSGKTSNSFTGCSRAQYNSIAIDHYINDAAWLVDSVFVNMEHSKSSKSARKLPNYDDIYNYIEVPYGDLVAVFNYEKGGEAYIGSSEEKYGKRVLRIDNDFLSDNDYFIAEAIAWRYYDYYSYMRNLLELETRWQPQLDLGDQLSVRQDHRVLLNYTIAKIRRIELDLERFFIKCYALVRPSYRETVDDYEYQ